MTDREPRDPREPDDPRDPRDERAPDDPRDERDPYLGDERNGIPRFVKALAVGIAMGLVVVIVVAWQLAALRANEEKRDCERAVGGRDDNRAVWLYLVAREPERADDPDVVDFVKFLNERLPPLTCADGDPTPMTTPTTED